jgi:hypothetical protein
MGCLESERRVYREAGGGEMRRKAGRRRWEVA